MLMIIYFTDADTTDIYTLSLHDALPIWSACPGGDRSQDGTGFRHPDRFGVGAGSLVPQGLVIPAARSFGLLHRPGLMEVGGGPNRTPAIWSQRAISPTLDFRRAGCPGYNQQHLGTQQNS